MENKNYLLELPKDTPCLVRQSVYDLWNWKLAYYATDERCYNFGRKGKKTTWSAKTWDYIIPVEKFNFRDPEGNQKSEYNYGTKRRRNIMGEDGVLY